MMKTPTATHRDQVGLFRLGVVGDLIACDLETGELKIELMKRAKRAYRPPDADASRTYHWKTLQRWYYQAKENPLLLVPHTRKRGTALAVDPEKRELLLQMRREHPSAAVELLLDEAVRNEILAKDQVSPSTVRRLYREHQLSRTSLNRPARSRERRRWQARRVGAIWHGDVCHVWRHDENGLPRKVYVHALMDDYSRFVVALEARAQEREVDMLAVLCRALMMFPAPEVLYLDNGSCYRGDTLALACTHLDIRLVHPAPYDPEARGTQERLWRTLRQQVTDHVQKHTPNELNVALKAWLDTRYHRRPHAGLLGKTPRAVFLEGAKALPAPRTARELARALEVPVTRKVAGDSTFTLDGQIWEVAGRHLAGQRIEVVVDPFTGAPLRATHDGRPVVIGRCDPIHNGQRGRAPTAEPPAPTVPFDPIVGLLAAARTPEIDHE